MANPGFKNLNMPIPIERHEDLATIQKYYSKSTGLKLTKVQTIQKLLFESANLIKNEGRLHS